jgi:outer membrane immunogenic protein
MKKFALAIIAATAFTGSAFAADMAPRTYTKAPPPPVVAPSWTGFYIFGGGGYGMWNSDEYTTYYPSGVPVLATQERYGGSGYFGTVGAGYDWQFAGSWVAGVFADGQFGSLRGTIADPRAGFFRGESGISGDVKVRDMWAAGVRVGYLVAPNVYSYVNGGYTGSNWSGSTLLENTTATPDRLTNGFTRQGWFVGGGVENSLGFFGPGWFMKTEYRASEFDRIDVQQYYLSGNPTPYGISMKPWVQTVSTSLVYRFNWGGPVVAKY